MGATENNGGGLSHKGGPVVTSKSTHPRHITQPTGAHLLDVCEEKIHIVLLWTIELLWMMVLLWRNKLRWDKMCKRNIVLPSVHSFKT